MTDPNTAITIMGIRIASRWKPAAGRPNPDAAANAPNPITTLMPLIAITAVHALCKSMKNKLVALTSQRAFLFCSTSGTGVSKP